MKSPNRNFQPSSPSPLALPRESGLLPLSKMPPVTALSQLADSPGSETAQVDENDDDDKNIPSTLRRKLSKFPLFKDAPKSFHSRVGTQLKLVQYHPREYIIKEGDPALSMYWILKGSVSVTSTDGDSIYAELTPGCFFGEIGILFNRPRTATVIACSKVLVGVLTADALNVVLRSYPLIERRIRDEAQERLAMQEKKNKADIPIIKLSKSPAPTGEDLPPPPILSPITAAGPLKQLVNASRETSSLKPQAPSADNVDQTVSIQEFIKSVPIFHNLPSEIIHNLALGVEPISFKPYEFIVRKGQSGTEIYFITHGEVEVLDPTQNMGNILARLKPGSYFGEMSFLEFIQGNNNVHRSASIRSVTSVELIVIKTDQLEQVCQQYPEVVSQMRETANARKSSNGDSSEKIDPSTFLMRYALKETSAPTPIHPSKLSKILLPPPQVESTDTSPSDVPDESPFFNPNWNFSGSDVTPRDVSRSVSPVSHMDMESIASTKTSKSAKSTPELTSIDRKRKSVTDAQLPSGPLNMSVPPLNPTLPLRSFLSPQSRRNSFQYMPHNKRIKLSNLAGRRRSSVLVSAGSIPDKVLLGVFEFLTLPELMKLRIVSRRWRQLLYVAPNLLKKLDLTPWNTRIDDEALISITDFVGSRPTHIDISNCFHITDEGFSYLVNEIGMAGQITVFKMRSLWEVSAMAIMDLTSPTVGRHLEEVDLSNCRKVKDNVVERLLGWSSNAYGETVYLPNSEGVYNNDAGSEHLRVLNLGYCKYLTDNIMYHISLHANHRLESLDLTRCTTITDAGFQHWAHSSFPNLKKLTLKDCTFLSDKSIISLANAAPNLEILNLNFCCSLSDMAIEVLSLGCQKLRELDLSFCGSAVSDSSLVTISMHLSWLEKLILKGCVRVTRAGIDALLSGCSPLNFIDISQCRNAHMYPGRIPAQTLRVNPDTKSAFIAAGTAQKIIEIVI